MTAKKEKNYYRTGSPFNLRVGVFGMYGESDFTKFGRLYIPICLATIPPEDRAAADELVEKWTTSKSRLGIGEIVKYAVNTDKTSRADLEKWSKSTQQERIAKSFEDFFEIYRTTDIAKAPGHGKEHSIDLMNSALHIFHQYENAGKPVSEAQKLLALAGAVIHDMGRYIEPRFQTKEAKELSKTVAPTLTYEMFRRGLRIDIPPALAYRLFYITENLSKHPSKYGPQDPISMAILGQCDREAVDGTAVLARELAFDVGIGNLTLTAPIDSQYITRVPIPGKEDCTSIYHEFEFYLRNVYPPVSPEGEVELTRMKTETVAMLVLAFQGKPELYEQLFAPELGLVSQENLHWSKKTIPAEIFAAGIEEAKKFKQQESTFRRPKTTDGLVSFTHGYAISDGNSIDINRFTLEKKISVLSKQERRSYLEMCAYGLTKRHQRRLEDLEWLETEKTESPIEKTARKLVIKELKEREEFYTKTLPGWVS